MQDAPGLAEALPPTTLDAFASDIRQRFGDRGAVVDALFCALAWSQGEGVSRRCWALMATAVVGRDPGFDDADVDWVLQHAGWHVLEGHEDGQAVYRLAHQAFADHYRSQSSEQPESVHQRIATILTNGLQGLGWLNCDPYLRRHLATHAHFGGVLDRFVRDAGYLAVAVPFRLASLVPFITDRESQRIAAIYRRAIHAIERADTAERMALLHLAAQQNDPSIASIVSPLLVPRWQCRWARWRPEVQSTAVARAPKDTTAVAVVYLPNVGPLLICGAGKEVVGWWLDLVEPIERTFAPRLIDHVDCDVRSRERTHCDIRHGRRHDIDVLNARVREDRRKS